MEPVAKPQLEFEATVNVDQLNKLLDAFRSNAEGANKAVNDLLGGTVTKKVVLETVTDDSGVKKLVAVDKERLSVADRIRKAEEDLNKVQQGSLTNLRQQVNQAKQARDQLAKYEESAGAIAGKVRQLNGDWVVANQKVAQLTRELDLAGASTFWQKVKAQFNLGGLASFSNGLVQITQTLQAGSILIGGFISQINNLVTAVAKLQSFELSFVAAGAGQAGGAQALEEASRIALGLGSNLNVVRDGFQRLTPVILNSGGSISNVSQITEALSSRFAAFGLSADASRRVMNGVIQAFAKGKLQAEELTQQISEADPAFKTDFAGALGVTIQQLEAMVNAGQITNDVLLRTLPLLGKSALLYGKLGTSAADAVGALDQSSQAIGGVGVTTEQVRTQLDTLSQLNFERFAIAFQPVIQAFLKAQAVVIDFITYITQLEGTRGLSNVLAALAQSVINLLDGLTKVAGVVATAISPLLQLAGAVANNAVGIGILTTVIGVKLLTALKSVPAALTSGFGAFQTLGASITQTIAKYAGLGTAATAAATKVTAAQAAINAAGATGAGGAATGGLASYIPADLLPKIEAAKGGITGLNSAGAKLFPTFSKVGAGIKNFGSTSISVLSNIGTAGPAALKGLQSGAVAAGAAIKAGLGGAATAIVGVLTTSLTGLAAVAAPVAAAFLLVGAATKNVNTIMSGAKQINDNLEASITDIEAALGKLTGTTEASVNAWQASKQEVGGFGAVTDVLLGGLQNLTGGLLFATNQEAKYNQATIAAAESSEKFRLKIGQLESEYKKLIASSDGSVESKAKEKAAEDALTQAYSARIGQLGSQIQALEKLKTNNKFVEEAKQRLIATLQVEKMALEASATAGGFNAKAMEDQAAAAKQLAQEIKAINDIQIQQLRENKTQIQQRYQAEATALQEQKRIVEEKFGEEKRQIQQAKTEEQNRYNAIKEQFSDQKRAIQETYSAQKEAINQVRQAEAERANAAIRNLQALTPAERELQKLRIGDLQKQAKRGGREGLEARAQLERIRANEQIARIQEEERKKEEEAKRETARIEREEKAALKAIAAEERKAEREHREAMQKYAKEERDLEAKRLEETKKIEENIRNNKENERKAVLEIDGKISELQKQIADSTQAAAKAAGEFTGEMENADVAAQSVKTKMDEIQKIAANIRIPSINNARFAGGSVTAGGRYTVNELGKEMFLSSSGRLSQINARPWSTWTAPSSGTVIPAHIAAGINIPNGSVQVSRSNASLIDRSLNGPGRMGRILGKAIAAINASTNPGTSQALAMGQSAQATQLGKLTHAVNKLVDKDWNVQVNVRNTNDSLGYARAINRRI